MQSAAVNCSFSDTFGGTIYFACDGKVAGISCSSSLMFFGVLLRMNIETLIRTHV